MQPFDEHFRFSLLLCASTHSVNCSSLVCWLILEKLVLILFNNLHCTHTAEINHKKLSTEVNVKNLKKNKKQV